MGRSDAELRQEAAGLRNRLFGSYVMCRRFFAVIGMYATIMFVMELPPVTTVAAAIIVAVLVRVLESKF